MTLFRFLSFSRIIFTFLLDIDSLLCYNPEYQRLWMWFMGYVKSDLLNVSNMVILSHDFMAMAGGFTKGSRVEITECGDRGI